MLITCSYNMALDFVEPGSCNNPPSYFKDIKVYPDLHMDGSGKAMKLENSPGSLLFTIGQPDLMPQGWEQKELWIGWANGDSEIKVSSYMPSAPTSLTTQSTRP